MRDQKVMIDRDLAEMYGVETGALNQAVKRNLKRFPDDFMFQMTNEELTNWKSHFVTSSSRSGTTPQFATVSSGRPPRNAVTSGASSTVTGIAHLLLQCFEIVQLDNGGTRRELFFVNIE